MSCLGPGYNPQPPRAWSRVESTCTQNTDFPTTLLSPITNTQVPLAAYSYDVQSINKGNILQYKNNSSNLTKNQRYSQIAKGKWTNRTKTWATQSDTYSNPNTASLKRVNYTSVTLPNGVTNPFGCQTTTYEDGGNLLGNQTVNPCTNEVTQTTYTQSCYPTSDSNVPGKIQLLCWNSSLQTWYPRQRRNMNNSGNKWPVNYKLFVSANAIPAI